MTLTPRDLALASMAAPEPESRLTSSRTLAPLVIICSACCCWVDLSPWALSIVESTPAALNAWLSSGRSKDSQRIDDCVSGSSTPTFGLLALVLLLPDDDELLLLEPHAATANDNAHNAPPMASARRESGECITVLLLLWNGTSWVLVQSKDRLPRGRRAPVPRATRRVRPAFRRQFVPARRPRGSRIARPPRAAARGRGRPPSRARRQRPRGLG